MLKRRGVGALEDTSGKKRIRDVILVKKPLAILFLVAFFLLLIIVLGDFFTDVFERLTRVPTCGDGSFYDTCSLNDPYFCEEGLLVERASVCGCPEGFRKKEDSCTSNYHIDPKDISLDYTLNGKREKLDLVVYGGVADYLHELPKTIYYRGEEKPLRVDFKLKHIDEEVQREFLLPLLVEIQNIANSKEDQMRIAVSLVQNIPFGASNETVSINKEYSVNYSRYPYEVLYDGEGICGEKSELLAFLLREMGYGVVLFYNNLENHESVGIKCPVKYSWDKSGYCFVETSGPAIISDDEIEYVNGIRLKSEPEIMLIADGASLPDDLEEYVYAEVFKGIRKILKEGGNLNDEQSDEYERLKKKYGLLDVYEV
jgi:hypothetical protein